MKELPEVGKTRLAEYKAIRKKVDAKAKRLTRKTKRVGKYHLIHFESAILHK